MKRIVLISVVSLVVQFACAQQQNIPNAPGVVTHSSNEIPEGPKKHHTHFDFPGDTATGRIYALPLQAPAGKAVNSENQSPGVLRKTGGFKNQSGQ